MKSILLFLLYLHILLNLFWKIVLKRKLRLFVIATSAFKEIGRGTLQDELTQYCRDHELPLIGPNLVGMGSPYLNFNCGFIPYLPIKGPVAMISQSGANLLAALGTSQKDHFGMSFFVGLGNKLTLISVSLYPTLEEMKTVNVLQFILKDWIVLMHLLKLAAVLINRS